MQTKPEDVVIFLESWQEFLDKLRFCKDVHDSFQDFEFMLNRFLRDYSRSGDIQQIQDAWGTISFSYRGKVENILTTLPQRHQESVDIRHLEVTRVPLTIRDNSLRVSEQYPEFLRSLSKFQEIYNFQETEIVIEQRIRDFSRYNDELKRYAVDVLARADKLILNLVPILIYSYDEMVSRRSQ